MPSKQRSLRVPKELDKEIRREIECRGERDWSKGAISLMEEAIRASRVPEEIDERLAREADWTPERVAEELPFTRRMGG